MPEEPTLLLLHRGDRLPEIIETMLDKIESPRFRVVRHLREDAPLDAVQRVGPDVVLYDSSGLAAADVEPLPEGVQTLLTAQPGVPVVVLTAADAVGDAVQIGGAAVRAGAADFLRIHQLSLADLERSLTYALARYSYVNSWIQTELFAHLEILTAGLSHQFNNIHTAIQGFAELLLRSEALAPDDRRKVDGILRAVERATHLIRQVGLVSSHHFAPRLPAPLHRVVEEQLGVVELELTARGITLERRLRPVPPVLLEPHRLGQAFLALLVNAVHAAEGTSEATPRILVSTGFDEQRVWVQIADNGIGIATADELRLFCPFFGRKGELAQEPHGASQRGTGLGLTVAYGIVRAHGGRIDVAARGRRGAAFTLSLPRSRAGRITSTRGASA